MPRAAQRRFRLAVVAVSLVAAIVGSVLLALHDSSAGTTAAVSATEHVPGHPRALLAGRDALWVALARDTDAPAGGPRLVRLDLATRASAQPVYLGGAVSQLARVGDRVLASVHHGGAGELKALDWDTGAVRGQQWFDGPIDELVVQRSAVWALERTPARLVRLDPKTLDPTSPPLRLPAGRVAGLAAGDGYLWVTAPAAHELLRIDPVTQTLKYVPLDGTPAGIAFSGSSVWFADRARGVVGRIDPESLQPVGEPIHVGKTPSGLAATAGTLFVVDEDGTVRRIDVGSGRTLGQPISVGRGLSFSPAGRSLWVGRPASTTLDRIDGGANRGGDVLVRVSGMNDDHKADRAPDGTTVTSSGRFSASGAISERGKVLVSRVENGPLITIRYVALGRSGTITFVVRVDRNAGTSRWTIASATKTYRGLRGEGIETPSADYTVDVLTGAVSR